MDTVPQALEVRFESTGFEDAISIGGDSDTVAAITGSVTEAYYGIPEGFGMHALQYLDEDLICIVTAFESDTTAPENNGSAPEHRALRVRKKCPSDVYCFTHSMV